jgi:hypothetical protein
MKSKGLGENSKTNGLILETFFLSIGYGYDAGIVRWLWLC